MVLYFQLFSFLSFQVKNGYSWNSICSSSFAPPPHLSILEKSILSWKTNLYYFLKLWKLCLWVLPSWSYEPQHSVAINSSTLHPLLEWWSLEKDKRKKKKANFFYNTLKRHFPFYSTDKLFSQTAICWHATTDIYKN